MSTSSHIKRLLSLAIVILISLVPSLANIDFQPRVAQAALSGDVSIDIQTGYNLVVDSNVLTPATYAPDSFMITAEICNTTGSTLENVTVYAGNFDTDVASSTPGEFPVRNASDTTPDFSALHPDLYTADPTASYSLTLEGGASGTDDAIRDVRTLDPFECVTQYWLTSYPSTDPTGSEPVYGANSDTSDDLWLEFDVWASWDGATETDWNSSTFTVTMRSEISASANKILPNGDNKVPQEWRDALAASGITLGWDTVTPRGNNNVIPGEEIVYTQGVWYDAGNVVHGFDNDGDGIPDQNLWLQPVGDSSLFDPSYFRLVRSYGILLVKAKDGTVQTIEFEDQLYFENLADNTGVVGLVFYEFVPRNGSYTGGLTPYQEAASGFDNEKFSADFGVGLPPIEVNEPLVELGKTASPGGPVAENALIDYTLTYENNSYDADAGEFVSVGSPDFGLPFIVEDKIPADTSYEAGTASIDVIPSSYTGTVTLQLYDNVNKVWVTTATATDGAEPVTSVLADEPAASSVSAIRWVMEEQVPATSTTSGTDLFTVGFQARVTDPFAGTNGDIFIENCVEGKFGTGSAFNADDPNACATNLVAGDNSIDGTVFEDLDADGFFNTGDAEVAIEGLGTSPVELYILLDGEYVLVSDAPDLTGTAGGGDYLFSNLPDGTYQVRFDIDPLPDGTGAGQYTGWTYSSPQTLDVVLSGGTIATANFGILETLAISKTEVSPAPATAGEGDIVTYQIDVSNLAAAQQATCEYTFWANTRTTSDAISGGDWNFPATSVNPWSGNAPGTDGLQAQSIFNGQKDDIVGSFINSGTFAGNVGSAEVLVNLRLEDGTATDGYLGDDLVNIYLFDNGNVTAGSPGAYTGGTAVSLDPLSALAFDPFSYTGTALDDAHIANTGQQTVSIPVPASTYNTWTATNNPFDGTIANQALAIIVEADKVGAADNQTLYVDEIGIRFTTDSSCGGNPGDTTIATYDLTDSYDADLLEFVSAFPIPTSVSETPGGDEGVEDSSISWQDVGTLIAGGTDVFTVNFRAREPLPAVSSPDDTASDTASISNAVYTNGLPANNPSATETTLIEDRGTFSGRVWEEGAGGTNGNYDSGIDTPWAGVSVTLYGCYTAGTDTLITSGNNECTNGGIGGEWRAVDTVTTAADGTYQFVGLRDGRYIAAVEPTSSTDPNTPTTPAGTSPLGATQISDFDTVLDNLSEDPTLDVNDISFVQIDVTEDLTDRNFSYAPVDNATISGTVYNDANETSTQDGLESGYANVTVTLEDCGAGTCDDGDESIYSQTTTDSNGDYTFLVPPGNYRIIVDEGDLPLTNVQQTDDPDGPAYSSQYDLTVAADDNVTDQDFGYREATYDIGDQLYYDYTGNGSFDGSDVGIPNVTIALYNDAGGGTLGTLVDVTSTSGTGSYTFTDVAPGNYVVVVDTADPDFPADFTQTADPEANTDNQGLADATIGDVTTMDFGYQPTNLTIDGTLYYDDDGLGSQDVGEAGISNVTVILRDCGPDGTCGNGDDGPDQVTTTDANGNYEFTNLPSGNYEVVVDTTDPAYPQVSNQTEDPDEAGVCASCDDETSILLTGDTPNVDFGYQRLSSIGDTVFYDLNQNGDQDFNEPGIENVNVLLYDADPCGPDGDCSTLGDNPAPIADARTDSDGKYLFENLDPGTYFVVIDVDASEANNDEPGETLPATQIATDQTADPDNDGLNCTDTDRNEDCDNTHDITTTSGSFYTAADFGYEPPTVIGDSVWIDQNGNGIQEEGELPITNVTVNLYTLDNDVDGDGYYDPGDTITFVTSTTTNIEGKYYFDDNGSGTPLADGTYIVQVDSLDADFPANLIPGFNSDHDTDSVNAPLDDYTSAVINAGTNDTSVLDADFGYEPNFTGELAGTICLVTDSAGTCDGNNETPQDGYTVILLKNNGGVWEYVTEDITDGSGNYQFVNLDTGDYRVVIDTTYTNLNIASLTTVDGDLPGGATITDNTTAGVGGQVYEQISITDGTTTSNLDFAFEFADGLDFGDLPESTTFRYNTTLDGVNSSGPRHIVQASPTLYLGLTPPDGESDGLTNLTATGDNGTDTNDEDGVTPINVTNWADNTDADFTITGSGSGYLVGWIDWNQDGDFGDEGEFVVNRSVDFAALGGTITFNDITIPTGTVTPNNPVSLYARFRLLSEEPLIPSLSFVGLDANGGETEDYQFQGAGTNPVTLSYFLAKQTGNATHIEWTTVLEIGNVGFNIYTQVDNRIVQINDELIESPVVDSTEPQDYKITLTDLDANTFYLEDVDIFGTTRMHGPFYLGVVEGVQDNAEEIDWATIGAENDAEEVQRLQQAIHAASNRSERANEVLTALGLGQTPSANQKKGRAASSATTAIEDAGFPAMQIRVDETGIVRLTYNDLLAAGLDLTNVPANAIAVTNQGDSVPVYVSGKGKLNSNNYIEFYAEALDTLYTDTNVYTLTIDRAAANHVRSVQGKPGNNADYANFYMETTTYDRDVAYSFSAPMDEPWYERRLLAFNGRPQQWSTTLPVDNYVAGVAPVTLQVNMFGSNDWRDIENDHHIQVDFNGTRVYEARFGGIEAHIANVTVEGLQNGANTLRLHQPADTGGRWDIIGYDSAVLTYPRAFVAQDGALTFTASGEAFEVEGLPSADVVVYRLEDSTLTRLKNVSVSENNGSFAAAFAGSNGEATYYIASTEGLVDAEVMPAPESVNLAEGTADYLIISHPNFIDGLQPLISMHESNGMTVRTVDINDVYNQYSGGVYEAQAIRDFIADAKAEMGVQYVLLVGGDSYDYRGYVYDSSLSFIPTLYDRTDQLIKFAPVDQLYADTDYDGLPDVALGRFPVRTNAELDLMVQKTLAYANRDYTNTAVFAADTSESANPFGVYSDGIAATLPSDWEITRAYLDEMSPSQARNTLIAGINDGTSLVSFMGHSSYDRWTFKGLFSTAHMGQLTNEGSPTVVLQWGCWNTYSASPTRQTMGDQFLTGTSGGAAVVMGASTLTYAETEAALGRALTPLLVQEGMSVGQAMLQAKEQVALTHPDAVDVFIGWTILGDPATVITNDQ